MNKSIIILLILFLQNCFDKQIVLKINKNGSGTITETVIMTMKPTTVESDNETPEEKKKQEKENFEKNKQKQIDRVTGMGQGVKFESFTMQNETNKHIATVVYSFKDINHLTINTSFEDKPAEPFIVFQYTPGKKSSMLIQIPKKEEKTQTTEAISAEPAKDNSDKSGEENTGSKKQMENMLKNIFKDLKMSFVIHFESPIKKTNAAYLDEKNNSIILYDVAFSEFLDDKNKDKFEKLSKSKADLANVFKDGGLKSKFELNHELKVEF